MGYKPLTVTYYLIFSYCYESYNLLVVILAFVQIYGFQDLHLHHVNIKIYTPEIEQFGSEK